MTLGRLVTAGLIALVALPAVVASAGAVAGRHFESEVHHLVRHQVGDLRGALQLRALLDERTAAIRALQATGSPEYIAARANASGQFGVRLEYLRKHSHDPELTALYDTLHESNRAFMEAARKLPAAPAGPDAPVFLDVLAARDRVEEAIVDVVQFHDRHLEEGEAALARLGAYVDRLHLALAGLGVLIGLILVGAIMHQLEAAFAAERAAVRARDDVLAFVSHDLKTPLSSILFSAELLLRKRSAEDQGARQIDLIRRNAWRMDTLIKDLVDVASVTDGSLVLNKERCDLGRIVQETVEEVSGTAIERRVTIDAPRTEIPEVQCATARVRQVLENLVGNALKHGHEGGRVGIEVTSDAAWVRVSVIDDGPGVPMSERESIFEPYRQGSRHNVGSGLGLAIARGIIEGHGGRLWVESNEGRGAAFRFTLPRAPIA